MRTLFHQLHVRHVAVIGLALLLISGGVGQALAGRNDAGPARREDDATPAEAVMVDDLDDDDPFAVGGSVTNIATDSPSASPSASPAASPDWTDNDGTDSDGVDTTGMATDNDGTDSDGVDTTGMATDNDGTDSDGVDTTGDAVTASPDTTVGDTADTANDPDDGTHATADDTH